MKKEEGYKGYYLLKNNSCPNWFANEELANEAMEQSIKDDKDLGIFEETDKYEVLSHERWIRRFNRECNKLCQGKSSFI